jgi:hypothetical protein
VNRLRFLAFAFSLAFGVFAVFQAVHAQNANDGYASLKDRELPRTPAERNNECAWIRSEAARIRSQAASAAATAAQYNSPALAQSIQAAADRDLPQLEDRSETIQCDRSSAAPPRPAVMRSQAVTPSQPAAVVAPAPAVAAPPAVVAPAPAVIAASPAVAAPSSATAAPPPAIIPLSQSCSGLTFDQCFTKCRELTDRTKAQCFDACRH